MAWQSALFLVAHCEVEGLVLNQSSEVGCVAKGEGKRSERTPVNLVRVEISRD